MGKIKHNSHKGRFKANYYPLFWLIVLVVICLFVFFFYMLIVFIFYIFNGKMSIRIICTIFALTFLWLQEEQIQPQCGTFNVCISITMIHEVHYPFPYFNTFNEDIAQIKWMRDTEFIQFIAYIIFHLTWDLLFFFHFCILRNKIICMHATFRHHHRKHMATKCMHIYISTNYITLCMILKYVSTIT